MIWERKRSRRIKPHKKKKFSVWPISDSRTLLCPRCKTYLENNEIGKKAHGISCVKIPKELPSGWGVKQYES